MVTGSRELIREMNRRLVLETVINDGPLSRAAISKKLGLTKATISAIVQDLLDEQYIEEIGSDQTQYGRKPILLQFCRQNGYIITLDLGVECTVLMVCDLLGQNCRLHQYNCTLERNTAIDFLLQIIQNQIRLLPATPFGVVGIGIGIHGTVCRNEITFTPNYHLADLPIVDVLTDALDIPVWLENEANLSALAEKTFVENHKNLIHVSIHAGVGAGIILDHHLYTGFAGTAGEAGHMIVQPGGRSCPCGNHGCLEQYISEPAVLSRYQELSGRTTVSIDDLVWSYNQKEADALAVVDEFTTYLACGINNLWNLFSPECIILNSQLTAYLPQLLPEILQKLSARFRATCQLKLSTLQDTGVLLGAARVCISKYLGIEKLYFSGFQP